jgi:hypothetical protein
VVAAVRAKKKLIAVDSDANPIRKSELAARVESHSGHHMDESKMNRTRILRNLS